MTGANVTESSPQTLSTVVRTERVGLAPETAVNPLLRLHLLLYGRYRWAILLGIVLGSCGGLLAWNLMPPQFKVVGYVRVRPYVPPVLAATDQNGILPMFETFVGLQESLLQSQRVLDQAGLNPDWKALHRQSPRWGQGIPASMLKVDHPRNSELITVEFTDEDPNAATIAVRSIVRAYQKISEAADGEGDAGRMQVLVDLQSSLNNQKRALSDQILAIANEYGSEALEDRYRFKLEESNRLETELQQVALEISVAEAAAGGAATTTAPATEAVPAVLTREDVAASNLQMRDALLEEGRLSQRLSLLRSRLGENHPDVQAAKDELQGLEKRIDALLKTHQDRAAAGGFSAERGDRLRATLPELRAREANIRALYEKVAAETLALGRKDLQIKKLKQEEDAISHRLDEAQARINQLTLESKMSGRISILNEGERPMVPTTSKRVPITAAASAFGVALGVALMALRGLVNSRVQSLRHVQHLMPAVRLLGILPVLPEDLSDPEQRSVAAHCVHQIRNLLEVGALPGRGLTLAITSPSAGDGKTSLALSLGFSFAAAGSKTLLIDADMVGGGLTRRLNALARRSVGSILLRTGLLTKKQLLEALQISRAANRPLNETLVQQGYIKASDLQQALAAQKKSSVGLLNALDGESLSSCLTKTMTSNLFILPVGDASAHHTAQMSNKAFRQILKAAREKFDVVLVDTGPILGSLEASIAAREVDRVILTVARGNQSPLVTRAIHQLGMLGAPLAGLVFNRATPYDVAYSQYVSASLASLRSVPGPNGKHEPLRSAGGALRLGPVASAVADAGDNGSASRSPTEAGAAPAGANGHAQESAQP